VRRRSRALIRSAFVALGLLVALVAVLGAWQVSSASSSQRTQIETGERTSAHLASSALSSALTSRLEQVTNLSTEPGVSAIFAASDRAELAKLASGLHEIYPEFASFDAVSAQGVLEARWPSDPGAIGSDLSEQTFFQTVSRTSRPSISGVLQQTSPPRELVVGLATPVFDSTHRVVGVIQGTLAASTIGSIIGGTQLPEGQLAIVDHQGHLLSGANAAATRSFRTTSFVSNALSGHTGVGSGPVPGLTGTRLVGYAPVMSTGWAVIAESPASTLNQPVAALEERLIGIALLVLVLAAGTAALLGVLLRRLGREQERAGALLACVGDGVATVDLNGRLVRVNPALEQLSGKTEREIAGQRYSDAFPLYDQQGSPIPTDDSMIAETLRDRVVKTSSGYSLHLGSSDGRRIPIGITASPLVVSGELEGAVVVIRDVSHEREIDQLKSSLVSTASHELRTPLTMIQGFSELLLERDDMDPTQKHEAVRQIHASSERLGRLIDDLLSVSRIESGKLTLDVVAVNLPEIIDEVLQPFRSQSTRRFTTAIDPILPSALADRDKTIQALTNLVSNAVKYSSEGSNITVAAHANGDHIEVSVVDEGIGMSLEESMHAFEKFTRVDNAHVRKAGGTGLGLYITKNLVELQRGQLWVTSNPGSGSTFTFSLPLAPRPDDRGSIDDVERKDVAEALDRR
jgi:PAS domain S-box-containing protein